MTSGSMVLPDYAGGCIVNLMRSIADACGAEDVPHPPARDLSPGELAEATNLVLLVVDGLGYDYLRKQGGAGALASRLRGRLTSVFPSTTASAITTFLTGLAPRQHGLPGWHTYFNEIDRILAVLPLTSRDEQPLETAADELPSRLFVDRPLAAKVRRAAFTVAPADIVASPFNRFHTRGAVAWGYGRMPQMFECLSEILKANGQRKFIHAYYPSIDTRAHRFGIASQEVAATFAALDAGFGAFLESIAGTDTVVVATADHGFIDSPPEHFIELDRHPRLEALLARPLCGERRVAYCYVEPRRREAFERYADEELGQAAQLFPSAELIERGWFGPGATHPRLASRIGDYALVMRDDWTIKDWMEGEKRYPQIGVHAGTSAAEMFVPLVVARV